MLQKVITISLDVVGIPQRIPVSQFDTGWQFQFNTLLGGQPWTIPSGTHAILNGKKPDNNVFAFNGTIQDNKILVDCDVQMTAVSGSTICELSFILGGKTIGSRNFILDVEAAPKSPSDISSESTLPAYAELLEVAAGLPDNIPQYIYDWLDEHPEATTTVQDGAITEAKLNTTLLDALTIQKTASGSIASFADGSVLPVKSLVAQIEAQQSGEGDPSPTNIRPITGFTEATVAVTNANLCYRAITQGGISSTGANSSTNTSKRCRLGISLIAPNTTYTASCVEGVIIKSVHYYARMTLWSQVSYNTFNSNPATFTTPADCHYVRLQFSYPDDTQDITPEEVTDVMLNVGNTALPYVPFVRNTVDVSWQTEAGTVYGGELDVTTGLLTVTHGYMSFDGTENWGSFGSGDRRFFRLTIDGRRIAASSSRFCSHYRNVTVTTSDTAAGYYAYSTSTATGGYVQIRPENAADMTKEEWKEWLAAQASAGTPVQATWMWETPVTYQLTTTEVATLLGQNNIWVNTGDIAVTYRADPSLVIAALEARIAATQNIIAGVETSMVATKNYSIGDLLIVGDVLYKATATIANGANITVGTNVAATTVAEQLLLLANA